MPEGLIDLYEEAFDENIPAAERQKLLNQFAIWALLKKEVSANFVAEVLGEKEEDVINFIATFTKWFNSPESGKYQLYHERLRVFLLQKLSECEICTLHKKIIERLKISIAKKHPEDSETYALEFISDHLLIEAFSEKDHVYGNEIIELAKNKIFAERQLFISNSFEWGKTSIQNAIHYLSKRNLAIEPESNNQMIELGLILIDKYNEEQNDSPRIVGIYSEGKFDLATDRIDAFTGLTESEKERGFILYLLCLIEQLCFSINKIDENGLNKLCAKMNNQISDRFVSSKLFPHEFIFDLACKLEGLGVNHLFLTNKIKNWNFNWLENYSYLNEINTKIILEIIGNESDLTNKNKGYSFLSKGLNKLKKYDESESVCELIIDNIEIEDLPF